jgi:hypothetical protein
LRVPQSAQYFATREFLQHKVTQIRIGGICCCNGEIELEVGLTKVDDKQNNINVPIACVLRAIRYLNMQQMEQDYRMDCNGQHGFQSMRPEAFYSTPASLQAPGVSKISPGQYPCIHGYDVYYNDEIWVTAKQVSSLRLPNRLIGAMAPISMGNHWQAL